MKKIFIILFAAFLATNFFSCDDWTDMDTKNFEPKPIG